MTPAPQLVPGGGQPKQIKAPATLELSDRDRAILVTLSSLRLMTGRQLQRTFFADDLPTSSHPRIARRVLQRLTDGGLLQRLDRRVGGLRAGSSSYVYALSAAGGRMVQADIGRGRRREPGLTFVSHTLAVSEACVVLQEARRNGRLSALQLQTEPRCWRALSGYDGGTLKPDLFVVAAVGEVEHLTFVEIDNSTEHGPAILRKAEVYEQHYQSGVEQDRLGVFPCVLWLADQPPRVARIRTALDSNRRLTRALHKVGLQADVVAALVSSSSNNSNEKGGA